MSNAIIIMAAGMGKRMKSELPKVLHKICGRSLLEHVILTAYDLEPTKLLVILGFKSDLVHHEMANNLDKTIFNQIEWVEQKELLGTGDAIKQCIPYLKDFTGNVLILSGDVPFLSKQTIQNLLEEHIKSESYATILTTKLDNPTGYGRILRGDKDQIIGIIEEKDANPSEKQILEINTGTYCFNWEVLKKFLPQLTNQNAQKEYYLTDIIKLMFKEGYKVSAYLSSNSIECLGISTKEDLANLSQIARNKINSYWLNEGVTILDPNTTYIDYKSKIGKDTVIYPGTILENTEVGQNSQLGPYTRIVNSYIGNDVCITFSLVKDSKILDKTQVGPFAHIRSNTEIGTNCRIGNFVEIKNTTMANNTKSAHLTYLGDSEIGTNTNIGAGTITCNYDGVKKSKTTIGNNVFVGSNSTLIAPVNLSDNSYIAAGSVITNNVPEGALAIARERQTNKEGWVQKRKEKLNECR